MCIGMPPMPQEDRAMPGPSWTAACNPFDLISEGGQLRAASAGPSQQRAWSRGLRLPFAAQTPEHEVSKSPALTPIVVQPCADWSIGSVRTPVAQDPVDGPGQATVDSRIKTASVDRRHQSFFNTCKWSYDSGGKNRIQSPFDGKDKSHVLHDAIKSNGKCIPTPWGVAYPNSTYSLQHSSDTKHDRQLQSLISNPGSAPGVQKVRDTELRKTVSAVSDAFEQSRPSFCPSISAHSVRDDENSVRHAHESEARQCRLTSTSMASTRASSSRATPPMGGKKEAIASEEPCITLESTFSASRDSSGFLAVVTSEDEMVAKDIPNGEEVHVTLRHDDPPRTFLTKHKDMMTPSNASSSKHSASAPSGGSRLLAVARARKEPTATGKLSAEQVSVRQHQRVNPPELDSDNLSALGQGRCSASDSCRGHDTNNSWTSCEQASEAVADQQKRSGSSRKSRLHESPSRVRKSASREGDTVARIALESRLSTSRDSIGSLEVQQKLRRGSHSPQSAVARAARQRHDLQSAQQRVNSPQVMFGVRSSSPQRRTISLEVHRPPWKFSGTSSTPGRRRADDPRLLDAAEPYSSKRTYASHRSTGNSGLEATFREGLRRPADHLRKNTAHGPCDSSPERSRISQRLRSLSSSRSARCQNSETPYQCAAEVGPRVGTRQTRRWRSPAHGHVSQADMDRVFYGQLRRASLPAPFLCKEEGSISEGRSRAAARIRKVLSPLARSRSLSEQPRPSSARYEIRDGCRSACESQRSGR